MADHLRAVRRALISVSDKTNLIELSTSLHQLGVDLVSTGGTAKALRDAGLPVRDVSELTQFPEMMDGRLKTLHPKVHGGLLAVRDDAAHTKSMSEHGIENIDLLVVNLYPFAATVASGADAETVIENIDIGGPAMIRGAAKNHHDVVVITQSVDYDAFLEQMRLHKGQTSLLFRRQMAQKAYAHTGAYDGMISQWFAQQLGENANESFYAFGGELLEKLRYGENPHQSAAFYKSSELRFGVTSARQIQGKALSYNNINDTDAAYELVAEFDAKKVAACAIIKHANPCGVASGANLLDAYEKALSADPVSAFGGIVALNQKLDKQTAEAVVRIFTEVVIAPDADEEAIAVFSTKKNLRLLLTGGLPDPRVGSPIIKTVAGGFLVMSRDTVCSDDVTFEVVTDRKPTAQEELDMRFALKVVKHAKSNGIVLADGCRTLGIGAGQTSRVDAVVQAVQKAKLIADVAENKMLPSGVLASDAFFPFPDGVEEAVRAGVRAIVQPGGSVKDADVIAAANAAGIAMVFTGTRHFKH